MSAVFVYCNAPSKIFWTEVKKKEVKLPLYLIRHYAMKTWGSGGRALPFLTSALDEAEWSASRPGSFTVGERAPDSIE
jgi:hypothetical protein